MSRIAKKPIIIPEKVKVKISDQFVSVIGENDKLICKIHDSVNVKQIGCQLFLIPYDNINNGWIFAGTMRALLNNMIIGVTIGFTKRLQLVGIGYRVIVKDNKMSLSLGFSHVVNYTLPKGITVTCLSQTDISIKGADKQMVGQVAADLRAYRSPDPYKGKGIIYVDEIVRIKEAKKR